MWSCDRAETAAVLLPVRSMRRMRLARRAVHTGARRQGPSEGNYALSNYSTTQYESLP